MTTTKKLKIWTIIAHAFIVVGFGHGIITFGLIEIFWFPYITKDNFSLFLSAPFEARLPVVGLTTFLGQASLIYSIFTEQASRKLAFHLLGLMLLWISVVYFVYGLNQEGYVHFSAFTCLPFLICTLVVFLRQPIRQFYKWAIDE